MSNIRKMISISFIIFALLFGNANAQDVYGEFLGGQKYSAVNRFEDVVNEDGMRVKKNELVVRLEGRKEALVYKFESSSIPATRSSPFGFISIIVNSAGMEGSVRYEYLALNQGTLLSLGVVERQLHLGKTSSVEVQKKHGISSKLISSVIASIKSKKASLSTDNGSAYVHAALLLLSSEPKDLAFNKVVFELSKNKEIKADPIFLGILNKAQNQREGILRCGWLEKSMSSGAKISDSDGVWTIKTDATGTADGDLPKFNSDQWITSSSRGGYGCACLRLVANESTHEVVKIISSSTRPLLACRKDKKLMEPNSP